MDRLCCGTDKSVPTAALLRSATVQTDVPKSLHVVANLWVTCGLCEQKPRSVFSLLTHCVCVQGRLTGRIGCDCGRERDALWQYLLTGKGKRSLVDTDPVQCPWKRQRGNTRNGVPKSPDFFPLMDWCFSSTWKVIISLYLLRFTSNNKKLSPLPRSCFVPFNLVFLINGTAIPSSSLLHISNITRDFDRWSF